ncbi:MAG: hypothetical protein E7Z91_01095 [Cyanobacteria bacterium SIG30]|nr:hypothetical protein [Cyanobacteria bacterium SIG30]
MLKAKNVFDEKTLELIKFLIKSAQGCGVKLYFVGGIVRDILLKEPVKDIDMVVVGSAIDFCKNLEEINSDFKIKSIHPDFNTVKMNLDGIDVDFASTREEDYPKSGCLPVVKNVGCKLEFDIKRRDFTINSIALDINLDNNNEIIFDIIDLTNGIKDIKQKTLHILHDRSFIDDPTRILRALDFELRFKGFKLDKISKKLKDEYLNNPEREGLSLARVELTLKKIFKNARKAPKAFKKIIKDKIYKIYADETIADPKWGKRIKEAIEIFNPENPCEIYNQALKDDITKNIISNYKSQNLMSNFEIFNYFKRFSNQKLTLHYALTKDNLAKRYFQKLKDAKILTTGDILLKNGYNEGTKIGIILEKLLEEKLNSDNLKTLTDELIWVKNNF